MRPSLAQPATACHAGRFAGLPDMHYGNATHLVSGDMGISRWTISGTTPTGQCIRANGCDFYRFRGA
jgi:hypothetical protein